MLRPRNRYPLQCRWSNGSTRYGAWRLRMAGSFRNAQKPPANCWMRRAMLRCCHHGNVLDFGSKRSEEHTSELQSLMRISYAVFCLKKKKTKKHTHLDEDQHSKQKSQYTKLNNNIHVHTKAHTK